VLLFPAADLARPLFCTLNSCQPLSQLSGSDNDESSDSTCGGCLSSSVPVRVVAPPPRARRDLESCLQGKRSTKKGRESVTFSSVTTACTSRADSEVSSVTHTPEVPDTENSLGFFHEEAARMNVLQSMPDTVLVNLSPSVPLSRSGSINKLRQSPNMFASEIPKTQHKCPEGRWTDIVGT